MNTAEAPHRDLRPALVFLSGELIAVPIPLEREEVTLGRSLGADVRVNDSKASRKHAKIQVRGTPGSGAAEYVVTDLNSRNGTFLNGRRIVSEVLQHGDKISIGDHILRFELLDEIDREYQRQIHRLISHDDLTGLLSSRSFFSELRREASRARAESRPFCVLMMDLDHFKEVNDTFGHLVGNKTLVEVGGVIKQSLRSGDVAARFGGEEFAAFLLDADYAQAIVAAERVRSAIENHEFPVSHEPSTSGAHRITISIGIASFPDDAKDPIHLVELADSALYRAKRSGRNRICAYRASLAATEKPLPPRRS